MTQRYGPGPEDEGIPDLRDDTPEQYWSEDPQEATLPGDRPMAVDDHGTTADEMREGEPLDARLRREEPEQPRPENEPENPAGRLVEEDEGVRPDTEPDAVARDVGPDGGGYTAEERAIRVEEE
ncbi:DUF5709 domain-containing protein [Actinomadura viridis]|uniref:DUF5709 domain-containing protein n=1 Tax=Actinomadura viridis TaxID=58110 RepID=UPI0036D18504